MDHASIFDTPRHRFRTGFAELDRRWGWYLALGVFLMLLGLIASSMAVTTTMLSVVVLGSILLVAGIGLLILSFLTGKWSGFLITLSAGVLSVLAGFESLYNPFAGAAVVTLLLGTLLIAGGIFRSISSIVMQFPNWGWSLVSGIVAAVLGVVLVNRWQAASLWFLGLAIGIDLIVHGFSWIMFSLRLHGLAGELGITQTDRRAA